jgi:hypothetical protein
MATIAGQSAQSVNAVSGAVAARRGAIAHIETLLSIRMPQWCCARIDAPTPA